MAEGLTDKQRAFIEHYLTYWNSAEAARLAGYSEKTARSIGAENLTKPDIQAAIQQRLTELKMSADEVLARLTSHARGSIASFMRTSPDGEIHGFDLGDDKPLHLLHRVSITKRRIKDVTEDKVTIELYDAQAALALLGKHHRLFVDRTEITGEDGAALFPDFERALQKTYADSDPPAE